MTTFDDGYDRTKSGPIKRKVIQRGWFSRFIRNTTMMWAGNSLKNDLSKLDDLADFLHNSDTAKIDYKRYLDSFEKYF